MTKSQFATIYGCSKPYVSQLVAAKRLVLSDDGRLVNVEASLELLGATSDPSKAGVRERWAAFRAAQAPAAVASDAPTAPPPSAAAQPSLIDEPTGAPSPAAPAVQSPARSEYQDARARREQAEAELAQIELLKARGRVLEADGTLRAVADANTAVRSELMGLADRVTPLVAAETNPRKVWELINAECEQLCARMQQAASRLVEQAAAEVAA